MAARVFNSVLPAARPPRPVVHTSEGGEYSGLRLLDLSLVVVGEGDAAAELVRRRRGEGGRVCWLETRRQPRVPLPEGAALPPPALDNDRSFFSAGCWDLQLEMGARMELCNIRWYPPQLRRKQWGSAGRFWRSSVQLQEDESYTVVLEDDDRIPGIEVTRSQADGSPSSWEVSGAVVFAGTEFSSLKGTATVCETVAEARELDVSVVCEDAKPFATFRPQHVATWAALLLANYLVFFMLMGFFEPHLEPGSHPWWRTSIILVPIIPGGFTVTSDVWGYALTGGAVGPCVSAVMGFLCAAFAIVAYLTPIGWDGHKYYTWPLFMTTSFCAAAYMLVTIPLHVLIVGLQRMRQVAQAHRRARWRAHSCWFLSILAGTLGTWMLSYTVALLYIYLSSVRMGVVAAFTLPLMTSSVELLVVIITVQSYRHFVMGARKKEWAYTARGDQKELMIFPICTTHAYAEATRLVSIFVATVKEPGYAWIPPILLGFITNVLLRTSLLTTLLSRLVPSRFAWWIAPDSGTFLHNEARWFFGYPRFLPFLGLGLANLFLHGLERWPLFNFHSTTLVIAALLLELLEDMIVTSGVLHSDSWKKKLAYLYHGIDPMHPYQVMGFDCNGIQPSIPAIGFSGIRFVPFRKIAFIMGPSSLFGYTLLSLLLGAGFLHGACGSPIKEEDRLIDGLIWWSPLRC